MKSLLTASVLGALIAVAACTSEIPLGANLPVRVSPATSAARDTCVSDAQNPCALDRLRTSERQRR